MLPIQRKNADLARSGALVAVRLWVPSNVRSTVEPINTLAEIDTAIANTFIQEGIATSLGLEPIGTTKIRSSSAHEFGAYLFRIRLVFPEVNIVFEVDAVEVPYMLRPHTRVKCLIGRDILKHSVFVYNGHSNTFSLDFKG